MPQLNLLNSTYIRVNLIGINFFLLVLLFIFDVREKETNITYILSKLNHVKTPFHRGLVFRSGEVVRHLIQNCSTKAERRPQALSTETL